MIMSTPETPKKREPKSILLIGPPGGGKSTLAMQFPGVCFLDCDRNLDGPEQFLRGRNKTLSYGYIPISYDESGAAVPTERCAVMLMNHIAALKKEPSVSTVAVDNLTMVNEFFICDLLKKKGITELETRHWDTIKSMYYRLVSALRDLGKTTIVICHEKALTKPNAQSIGEKIVVGYQANVQSAFRDAIGSFFTDVWKCTSRPAAANAGVEFLIRTMKDTQNDLKNSMGMPPEIIVPPGTLAWDKIKQYFV